MGMRTKHRIALGANPIKLTIPYRLYLSLVPLNSLYLYTLNVSIGNFLLLYVGKMDEEGMRNTEYVRLEEIDSENQKTSSQFLSKYYAPLF